MALVLGDVIKIRRNSARMLEPDRAPVLMREVRYGELIPLGYGVAWKPWNRDTLMVMPIPLNLVVNLARWFWFGSMHWHVLDEIEKAEQAGYERGRAAAKGAE